MKKFNILLTGRLTSAIDDFFRHMEERMTCMTSSLRFVDIVRHLKVCEPDMLVLCLRDENHEVMTMMNQVKTECDRLGIAFAVLGSDEDCQTFSRAVSFIPDVTLVKPIESDRIIKEIQAYFDKKEEEELERQRYLEELRRQQEAAKKKHITIVDDDAGMLRLIRSHLEGKYEVATAINGTLAERFLERKKTDLILLDYEMPGESGAEVLSHLREKELTKDIPVIFLTGVTEMSKIKEVLSMKPQGYLLKPVDKEKLLDTIAKQLGEAD